VRPRVVALTRDMLHDDTSACCCADAPIYNALNGHRVVTGRWGLLLREKIARVLGLFFAGDRRQVVFEFRVERHRHPAKTSRATAASTTRDNLIE